MSTLSLRSTLPSSRTSLMYALPIRRLSDIVSHLRPGLTLSTVVEISSTRLPRLFNLNLSDGKQLLLSTAPSLAVRLLRHEQTMLLFEAILIHFLSNMIRSEHSEELPSVVLVSDTSLSRGVDLSQVIPTLFKHSSNTREMGYPYTIFESGVGQPRSDLSIHLNLPEQRCIDKQIGSLVRNLALITSPSRNFGTMTRVCSDPFGSSPSAAPPAHQSSRDWASAFLSILEGILRDGEDMSVLLPYEDIRMHFHQLSWRLGAITVPRLLVIDAGEATNVLIERDTEGQGPSPSRGPRLTGLRDWSQGLFGDPLLSSCFEDPSDSFLEGWRADDATEDIIEDHEGSNTRLLLYKCYRAVVAIVTEYYRPNPDSSRRELEGRRKLTDTLADLERAELGEQTILRKRSRSASISGVDDSPKRPKN